LAIAQQSLDFGTSRGTRVLTPHPGEMSTLLGQETDEIEADREATALGFSQEHNLVLVLKGRETLIASPTGQLWKNTAGTRGMGTAGSGDVLSGAIGALLAQKMEPPHAAVWGVYLHAVAGELAQQQQGDDGMMASDFLEKLPQAIRTFREAL
jgi:NAD(P)H-hydrate epimerase